MAIDAGCRPVVAVLGVSQPLAVAAELAELAAGAAVEAPPDADGHAVLQTYHSLADIVHLVVVAHFSKGGHLSVVISIVGKGARQLVGVAPVEVVLAGVEPRPCLVVVQRVATDDADVGKEVGIALLQRLGHVALNAGRGALFLFPVVGLVEGRHAGHGVLGVAAKPLHVGGNHGRPAVDIGDGAAEVRRVGTGFLVGSEDQRQGVVDDVKHGTAPTHHVEGR